MLDDDDHDDDNISYDEEEEEEEEEDDDDDDDAARDHRSGANRQLPEVCQVQSCCVFVPLLFLCKPHLAGEIKEMLPKCHCKAHVLTS